MPKAKIMIVEDEWIIANDLQHSLINMNYEVSSVVSTGLDAVRKAREDMPDMILMDIMLKDSMSGIEAAERIRKSVNIPQIFITAYTDEQLFDKAKKTDPYGYLIKPFDDRELKATIEMGLYRHKMESRLKESEEKFRSLFTQASDSIFLLSPTNGDLIIEDINEAALKIHGFTREELIGKSISLIDHPESAKLIPDRVKNLLNSGEPVNFEVQHIRKNGEQFPVEVSAQAINIRNKPYILAVDRDITERKKAEEVQQAERDRMFNLLDTLPAFVYLQSPDYSIRFANRYYKEHFGETAGVPCYQSLWDRKEPCEVCPTFKVFETGRSQVWEWDSAPDGRIYEINDYPFTDIDGTQLVFELGIDITERKKAEKLLAESEKKYRHLFATVPTGWAYHKIILDENNKPVDYIFLEVNSAFEKLTGLKREDIINRSVTEVLPGTEKDPADWISIYGDVALSGKEIKFENFSKLMYKWYNVAASSPEKGYFITVFDDITARKRAEDLLKFSEERFRGLVEATSDLIWEVDVNGVYTYMSPRVKEILGYQTEEIIGKTPFDLMPPEEAKRVGNVFKDIISEKGAIKGLENINIRKDGTPVTLETNGLPFFDAQGRLAGYRGIDRDITNRKKIERDLDEQLKLERLGSRIGLALAKGETLRELLQLCTDELQDHLNTAFVRIWTLNFAQDMLILQASSGMYTHLHGEHARIPVGQYKIGIIAKDKKAHFTNQVIGDPQISNQDWALQQKMVAFAGHPLIINDKVVGVMAMFSQQPLSPSVVRILESIADRIALGIVRKQAERALSESENRYRSIFKESNAIMLLIDPENGDILDANNSALQYYGYSLQDILELNISDINTLSKEQLIQEMSKVQTEQSKHLEFNHRLANGSVRDVEIFSGPVFVGGREVLFSVIHDITKRKHAEDARDQLTKELQQIIYATSHDLRSPLVNIAGYSKELQHSVEDIHAVLSELDIPANKMDKVKSITEEEMKESTNYIEASVKKMDLLLSGLLKLSKSGSVEIIITDCDMNRIVEDVLNTMEYQLVTAGAKCDVTELPTCRGDEKQVNQIFSNLIGNAIKYLDPERTGIIKVTGARNNNLSVYCVEDNGVGIEHDHLIRIFDLFHQIKPDSTGEGIGLNIVKKIIGRLDGDIWIESEYGKGSKFYVSLPG